MKLTTRLLWLCGLFVLSPPIALAEWHIQTQHQSDGTKCILSTWSIYQEPLPTIRERSSVMLTVESIDPFSFAFEIDSGIKSSLQYFGVAKISENMFVLEFDGGIGRLKDKAEKQLLIDSMRTGDKMPIVYARRGERNIFDNFRISGLDKLIEKIRSSCSFLG